MKTKLKGLTLLEILITIGIFALVAAAISVIFNSSIFVYKNLADKNKASQPNSIAMEWLTRDISLATCIYEADPNYIVLHSPTVGSTGGYVKYYLGISNDLKRKSCSVDHLLAEDLTSLHFDYYTSLNQPATTLPSEAEEVEITLKTSSGNQDFTLYSVASPQSCTDCLFSKTYGGSSIDNINCLQQTLNSSGNPDGYILGGYTDSFGPGGSGRNFLAIRTDYLGNTGVAGTWANTYGGTNLDELSFLQQTFIGGSPNGYILGGYTASFGTGGDFLVIKTDNNGNVGGAGTWANSYGSTVLDELHSLQQINDDSYILGGYTTSFANGGDFLVIKITNTGTTSWARTYGGTGSDELRFLQQTFSGGSPDGYILGGYTASFGTGGDFLVIKTDLSGTPVTDSSFGGTTGVMSYGGGAFDNLHFLQQTSDGGYILGGNTTSFGAGIDDFIVIRTDSLGNISCCVSGFSATSVTVTETTQTITGVSRTLNPAIPPLVTGSVPGITRNVSPTSAAVNHNPICPSP
ncbi:MAG: prepilin-type N-terminal cleavage/methylation domain-containing protein [Candidatus Omnitrophota bacterium]